MSNQSCKISIYAILRQALLKLRKTFKFKGHFRIRALYFNMQHRYFKEIYANLYTRNMKVSGEFLHCYLLAEDQKAKIRDAEIRKQKLKMNP